MEREQMIGKQSILFHNAVHILSGASMVGKKEGDGPLGKYFDKIGEGTDCLDASRGRKPKVSCKKKQYRWR